MKTRAITLAVRSLTVAVSAGMLLLLAAAPARAQDATPPPPAPSRNGGNGIGVGAAAFLSGVAGVAVDYDQSIWDVEAVLGFADRSVGGGNNPPSQTEIQAGVRGWYHLHHASSSDFSVGGGIGLDHRTGGGGANQTATLIEPGVRARAFITSNVAVHAVLGLSLVFGDDFGGARNSGIGIGTQGLFGFGFTYYFK